MPESNLDRRCSLTLMALLALLIALPGLIIDTQAAHNLASVVPPKLERFLNAMRAVTSPTARVLVAGSPPDMVFYRATYVLYPRIVYSAYTPQRRYMSWTAPPLTWPNLQRIAHHDGARYVLLWELPVIPHGVVHMHNGPAELVEVEP